MNEHFSQFSLTGAQSICFDPFFHHFHLFCSHTFTHIHVQLHTYAGINVQLGWTPAGLYGYV